MEDIGGVLRGIMAEVGEVLNVHVIHKEAQGGWWRPFRDIRDR